MPILQLKEVHLQYGSGPLLDGVDLQIEAGERVCLLGRNGAGKSSLIRLITGREKPDSGEIVRRPGLKVSGLTQAIPDSLHGTVHDVVRGGIGPTTEEEWQIEVRLEQLLEEMRLQGGAEFDALSGGLKRRVLLARALAGEPDLLLLDEPTNHLDLDSIVWIEKFLLDRELTLFFVTHDRTFLRKLSTRIVELDRGILRNWDCDYETYLRRRSEVLEAEEKQWAAFDKKLAQEEAWLRQGIKARRTRDEGRVRKLKELRKQRSARRERQGQARMQLQEAGSSGQKVIEAKNLTYFYENQPAVIRNLTTTIWRGDKTGIIGPNGCGKTTLLKLLLGELDAVEGEIKHGTNLEIVYLDQLRGQIDDAKTVAQNVAGEAEDVVFQGRTRNIHSYLQDFLFRSDRIRIAAGSLSGGERNRLLLARLFLQPANLLVLDEPTNDLDAETMELLEELLVDYQGTLLLVSHDRSFLDNVLTNTLVFEGGGQVTEYVGGYSDWVAQRPARLSGDLAQSGSSPTARADAPQQPSRPGPDTSGKPAWKKERPRRFLNVERRELEALPGKIEQLEARHQDLSEALGDPRLYRESPGKVTEIQQQMSALEEELRQAYARWEELEELREKCGE
jgi:ATP-binding cassette subfamily F protein uup